MYILKALLQAFLFYPHNNVLPSLTSHLQILPSLLKIHLQPHHRHILPPLHNPLRPPIFRCRRSSLPYVSSSPFLCDFIPRRPHHDLPQTSRQILILPKLISTQKKAPLTPKVELRTTPRAIPTANITKDLYISTILEVLHDFNTSSLMTTNLIISVDRRNTPEQAQEALDIALKYKDQGVVGLDLCGDPSKGDISIFTPVFTQAKEEGLGVTVHFAEIPTEDGKGELETLLSWKPDRLGHVIHVPEHLKREILERGIGVELCLSCNVLAKMMEHGTEGFGDHHFGWWWGEGEGEGIAVSVGFFSSFFFSSLSLGRVGSIACGFCIVQFFLQSSMLGFFLLDAPAISSSLSFPG